MPESQVQEFINKAQPIVNPPDAPAAPQNTTKVPFQTALVLTPEQEKRMIEHAFNRYTQIKTELGRDQTLQPNWWANQSQGANMALASQGLLAGDTFMGKRCRYDATFLNDVAWRPYTFGPNNIFFSSNIAVPVVRRICRQMIARAKNRFFGADKWFTVGPAPVPEFDPQDDAGIALRIDRFTQFKLGETQSNSKASNGRAIARALVLGECPVKTSYVVRDQIFNVEARVLHMLNDEGIAEPLRAHDGNYITEEDQWEDRPLLAPDQVENPGMLRRAATAVASFGPKVRVLKRDGITQEPPAPIYQPMMLDRRQVLFEGVKSEPIFFKDFLCPMVATDVQQADTVIHLYDKPVMEFVDLVVKRGMVGDTMDGRREAAQKMLALVRQLNTNSPLPKSGEKSQLRPNEYYMQPPTIETGGPIAEFAEFYLWYDANEDGIAENIMLICDRTTQMPIFYDYVANVTTDGLRPIEIVRINPVEGRWYGLGIMELFESYQTIIDLLVNRWNFSQSRAGRVDIWDPTATLEGDRDPNLKMNFGGTYSKKPGKTMDDIIEVKYLTDIKFDQIERMFQFFLQLLMNESGVANANDAQTAGLASSDLATGILETQQSGDELFAPIIDDLRPALQNILNREVDITLANMNPVEVFTYLEGDTQGIDQLTPNDVRGLKFKTQIVLSTVKNNQTLQQSAQAAALVEKFYMLPPPVQIRVVQFYRQQLRVLDPKADADTVLIPLTPMEVGLPGAEPAAGGGLGDAGPAGSTQFPTQLTQTTKPAGAGDDLKAG